MSIQTPQQRWPKSVPIKELLDVPYATTDKRLRVNGVYPPRPDARGNRAGRSCRTERHQTHRASKRYPQRYGAQNHNASEGSDKYDWETYNVSHSRPMRESTADRRRQNGADRRFRSHIIPEELVTAADLRRQREILGSCLDGFPEYLVGHEAHRRFTQWENAICRGRVVSYDADAEYWQIKYDADNRTEDYDKQDIRGPSLPQSSSPRPTIFFVAPP
eukprot:COSAG01_NODE_15741_length_1304_cov_5.104564_1_plen_218_part_00